MVGREERNRNRCHLDPGLYCPPECGGVRSPGVGIFECGHFSLAFKSRAPDANAEDQASAEAGAKARFYDQIRSGAVSLGGAENPPPGQVLSNRLVHREPPERDNGPEVADGES
jgi:hypothetical protein